VAQSPASSSLQVWLAGFFQARGLTAPNGQPLHRYRVDAAELAALKDLLPGSRAQLEEAAERAPWAGAFCLYITGMYGSEYEGEPAGWSSRSIEEALGGALTDEERTELLVTGLAFWKRSPRARDGMPDLASLRST
jgi:hypothetical protein